MKHRLRKKVKREGPVVAFLMGQFAAICFAIPTAALLWFATNKHLAIWGTSDTFIGAAGFWLILGVFAVVSLFLPRLFPGFLGKVWRLLISAEKWL